METPECLSEEAIIARICAADSGDRDNSGDAVVQPTRVVSSQEARRVILSLRDFVSAKYLLVS